MARDGKPSGLMRAAVRFPITLYKARMGWLLGQRFLMLTHTGRKSGIRRFTVLEVVDYDSDEGTYFVASGWGEKSQWLQNVGADPSAEITIGVRQHHVTAVRLSGEQSQQVFLRYARIHPIAFRKLGKFMTGVEIEPDEAGAARLAQTVPVVALKQTPQRRLREHARATRRSCQEDGARTRPSVLSVIPRRSAPRTRSPSSRRRTAECAAT